MKSLLLLMLVAVTLATPTRAGIVAPASTATNVQPADSPIRRALDGLKRRWLAFRAETPLTAQQRTQLREIVQPHQDEIRTQITAMRDAQSQLRKATTQDSDLDAAAAKVGEAARQGALLRARLEREIRPVLTPEQRQRLDSAMEEFKAGVGRRGAGR